MTGKPKRIGQVLKEMGLVDEAQIQLALARQREDPNRKIAEILMDMGLVTPVQVGQALVLQWQERVRLCEGRSLVVQGMRALLSDTVDIYDLQRKIVGMLDELEQMKEDLESLYQVSVAIAREQMAGRSREKIIPTEFLE